MVRLWAGQERPWECRGNERPRRPSWYSDQFGLRLLDGPMKGDDVPPAHHVLRHCRQGDLKVEDGTIKGVYPDAFEPDDDGISVTWMEYFGGSPIEQLAAARAAMDRGRRLRASNRLAKLKVSAILAAGEAVKRVLSVVHDPIEQPPERENLGHSLIGGIATDDDDLRNRIANGVLPADLEQDSVDLNRK